MSFSASSRPKVVKRSQSNTSLNVGLPPPIPSSTYQTYTSPNTRREHQPHRGDVSSTATSEDGESEDELAREPGWILPPTPARINVPGALNGMESTRKIAGKRMTLQERLAATASAAKVKKSDSNTSVGVPKSASSSTIVAKMKKSASALSDMGISTKTGDKVVVCVRIKPTTSPFASKAYEISDDDSTLTLADAHPNVVKRGGKSGRESEYAYNFDALLQFPARTPDLYQDKIAPLVNKTMNGFNSTIFAYGQTGSGKSFTMTGTRQELGIIPCAVDGVFDAINNEPSRAFLLRVSYVEIYNETIRDLLNFKKGPLADDEKPVIHTQKGKVYVEPLKEEIVSTPQEVVDLLERGNLQRRTGATDWNERSSRSHSVFTITVESSPRRDGDDTDIRRSCLNLIDLAGSEKAVSDLERRGEGKHINQSLLALREVINKLTEKHKKNNHIPYRNSKLTHLLENALDGQSNIAVICTLSVEEAHCAETLETLKFAGRCSQVETKAQKNILPASEKAVIRAKEDEISELKRQLQQLAAQGTGRTAAQEFVEAQQLQADLHAMEDRKLKLSTQLAKLNGEILTSQTLGPKSSGRPRRRISDSAQGLGLGVPQTPHAGLAGRRAVSGMSRVSEDAEFSIEEQPSYDFAHHGRSFNLEREIASLRRSLVAKEAEMSRKDQDLHAAAEKIANFAAVEDELRSLRNQHHRDSESARVAAASAQSHIGDVEAELERTRQELALTTEEKDGKLATLEKAVLELRESREELLIEEHKRYSDLEGKLLASTRDLVQLRDTSTSGSEKLLAQLADVQKEKAELLAVQTAQNEAHRKELNNVKADLNAQLSKLRKKAEKASVFAGKCEDLASRLAQAEASAQSAEADRVAVQETLAGVEAARDVATAGAATLQAENERLRRDAKEKESAVISELRCDIDKQSGDAVRVQMAHTEELKSASRRLIEETARTVEAQRLLEVQGGELAAVKFEVTRLRQSLADSEAQSAAHLVGKAELTAALERAGEEAQALRLKLEAEESARKIAEEKLGVEAARSAEHAAQVQKAMRAAAETQLLHDAELKNLHALQEGLAEDASSSALLVEQLAEAQDLVINLRKAAAASDARAEAAQEELSTFHTRHTSQERTSQDVIQQSQAEVEADKVKIAQLQSCIHALNKKAATADAAADEATSQISKLKSDLLQEREERQKLEQPATKPAAATRTRYSSSPAGHGSGSIASLEPLQMLVSATTGGEHSAAAKLQSRERQEIHRLEKIVEGQKAVIEELRFNLQSWQKQLQEQQKIVQMLTQDTQEASPRSSPTTITTPAASPLSPSRRQESVPSLSTIGSAKALLKTASHGQLAHNGSPSPLPAHPTQKSNSSARKGRRITIEHDINRLASNRSVDRAKAIFSTPEPATPARLSGQLRNSQLTPTRR